MKAYVEYAVGIYPVAVVVEDLNGDGILALAVVNDSYSENSSLTGSVSVLFGNGDGTFQSQQVYATGTAPSSVVVADFNDDGQLDLGVTNAVDETLGIYLNQGHGLFSQPTLLYGTGGSGVTAVTADFNQDQNADLAVICSSHLLHTSAVCVLLGNGDGEFAGAPVNYPAGSSPSSAAIADLNGDSKNDVVVANSADNSVSVFIGNGDGTVQPQVTYGTGNGPSSVAIADLNGDAKPDLVSTNQGDNTVSVLLNNGNGTFAAHVDFATADGPSSVAIGDVNGDGKPDLVVACESSGSVSVLLGNGDGSFQPHSDYAVGLKSTSVALGDFNGDGTLDLAIANAQDFTVSVLLNGGDGTFSPSTVTLPTTTNPVSSLAVAVGDLNRASIFLPLIATATWTSRSGKSWVPVCSRELVTVLSRAR